MAQQDQGPADRPPADQAGENQGDAKAKRKRRSWRLLPQSTPGRASCLMTLFLVLLVITVWIIFMLDPRHVPWRHSMSWTRILLQIGLVALIPYVLYHAVRFWMEEDRSQFPEIDYAWQAGVDALKEHGMSLQSAPIFLVLGAESEAVRRSVMNATGFDFRVAGVPEGPATLHWYANPDAIYLFCSDTSWLSGLTQEYFDQLETLQQEAEFSGGEPAEETEPVAPVAPATPTPAPVAAGARPSAPAAGSTAAGAAGGGRPLGTIMLESFLDQNAATASSAPAPAAGEQSRPSGTITLNAPIDPRSTRSTAPPTPPVSLPDDRPTILPSTRTTEVTRQLHYVCQLLRRHRQPVCAINGILTLLPFDMVSAREREAEELQRAVRGDLVTIQRSLQLRCPVTALVTGLNGERGFQELVRRVGRNRAASQRFGRRYEVRAVPTQKELEAFTTHICGVFEDWVYTLFREKQALTRPGNTRLYGLLCRIRCTMKSRLSDVLCGSFAHSPKQSESVEPFFFSGCYFAATGRTQDRQAFVRSVFDKLGEEQEEVEWTAGAIRADRRSRALNWLGRIGAATAVVWLLGMIIYDVFID